MNLPKLLSGLVSTPNDTDARTEVHRQIIRREAKIGGELFGPVPSNGRREFFCLNEKTWVWHEEWTDEKGARRAITTRYDVRPNGILKAQDGRPYQFVGYDEASRLYQAVSMYNKRVDAALYGIAA